MLYPTTITSKWQMTIPKQVRKTLGLKRQGRVVIQPPSIFDLAGTFHPKRNKGVSVLKAREYMERHYEQI